MENNNVDDHYDALGFGELGIQGIHTIRAILSLSVQGRVQAAIDDWGVPGLVVTSLDDDVGTPIIGHHRPDDLSSADQPPPYLLLLIDESDPTAIRDATIAGARAREAGVYLSMAVCVGAVTPGARAGFECSPEMRELRQTVDCLIFVEPMKWNATNVEPGTRVALALISTMMPNGNLVCCDLADMKQVLRGSVHATLAHIPLTRVQDKERPIDVADYLELKTNGAAAARGMFYAYGAPPDELRFMDFEAIGGAVIEMADSTYPYSDRTFVAAALLDRSLTNVAEVVACISFDDSAMI
jgi:hypothetical protein